MEFITREHEDKIYKIYRELTNINQLKDFENIIYKLDKVDLMLLLTISFHHGYKIKRQESEVDQLSMFKTCPRCRKTHFQSSDIFNMPINEQKLCSDCKISISQNKRL